MRAHAIRVSTITEDWLGDSYLTLRSVFHSSYSECRCTVYIETSLREFSIRSHDDVNVQQCRGIQTLQFISRFDQSFGDVNWDEDCKLTYSRQKTALLFLTVYKPVNALHINRFNIQNIHPCQQIINRMCIMSQSNMTFIV